MLKVYLKQYLNLYAFTEKIFLQCKYVNQIETSFTPCYNRGV